MIDVIVFFVGAFEKILNLIHSKILFVVAVVVVSREHCACYGRQKRQKKARSICTM